MKAGSLKKLMATLSGLTLAGVAGNRLDIKVRKPEEAVAVRVGKGGRIQVSDDKRMRGLKCSGRKPTVTNVDRINYKAPRSADNTNFTVSQPLKFAPGTRSYANGGSCKDRAQLDLSDEDSNCESFLFP